MSEKMFSFLTPNPLKGSIKVIVEEVGTLECQGRCLGDCVAGVITLFQQTSISSDELELRYELVSYDPDKKELVARKKHPRPA